MKIGNNNIYVVKCYLNLTETLGVESNAFNLLAYAINKFQC